MSIQLVVEKSFWVSGSLAVLDSEHLESRTQTALAEAVLCSSEICVVQSEVWVPTLVLFRFSLFSVWIFSNDCWWFTLYLFVRWMTKEAQTYAEDTGLLFMETSAKTAMNVNELFLAIGEWPFVFTFQLKNQFYFRREWQFDQRSQFPQLQRWCVGLRLFVSEQHMSKPFTQTCWWEVSHGPMNKLFYFWCWSTSKNLWKDYQTLWNMIIF